MKEYKTSLRNELRAKRSAFPKEKRTDMDNMIRRAITSLKAFKEAETVLCFVSMPDEINTHILITKALEMGKKVAVPRCVPGTRQMEFYFITHFDELTQGTFHVMEPEPNPERLYQVGGKKDFMVVPCLSCDTKGYRLGYGGGYYDRFLATFRGTTAVVAYHQLLFSHFWHGKYDLPCDIVVTERMVKYTAGRNNKSKKH